MLVQDDSWLRSRRESMLSRSVFSGIIGTRSGPGMPLRFTDGWYEDLRILGHFDNPSRSKNQSKATANFLHGLVFE